MASQATMPDGTDAQGSHGPIRRVVVGVDDSESGLAALRKAVALARADNAQLVAVRACALGLPRHGGRRLRHLAHRHVVLYFSGAEQHVAAATLTRQALRQAAGALPSGVVIDTPAGDPAVVLTGIACQPGDVLVVGHKHALSFRGVIHGSVTAYCLRHARCPVVVVPARRRGPASAA